MCHFPAECVGMNHCITWEKLGWWTYFLCGEACSRPTSEWPGASPPAMLWTLTYCWAFHRRISKGSASTERAGGAVVKNSRSVTPTNNSKERSWKRTSDEGSMRRDSYRKHRRWGENTRGGGRMVQASVGWGPSDGATHTLLSAINQTQDMKYECGRGHLETRSTWSHSLDFLLLFPVICQHFFLFFF